MRITQLLIIIKYLGGSTSKRNKKKMKDKDFITGKIESVVKKKDCVNGEKHFKLVYLENRYAYELCKVVMSRKQSNIYKVEVVTLDMFYRSLTTPAILL